MLVFSVTASGNIFTQGEINSSTSDFSFVRMQGNGSSTDSGVGTSFLPFGGLIRDARTVQSTYQFLDFSQTNKHKSFLVREDDAAGNTTAHAYRWANTTAITSIRFSASSGTYPAGSTFSLYGIEG